MVISMHRKQVDLTSFFLICSADTQEFLSAPQGYFTLLVHLRGVLHRLFEAKPPTMVAGNEKCRLPPDRWFERRNSGTVAQAIAPTLLR